MSAAQVSSANRRQRWVHELVQSDSRIIRAPVCWTRRVPEGHAVLVWPDREPRRIEPLFT